MLGYTEEPSYRQMGPREGCRQVGTGTELERSRRRREGEANHAEAVILWWGRRRLPSRLGPRKAWRSVLCVCLAKTQAG